MPEEHKVEPGEVHEKFWEKTVREAFKNDPWRIVIELIKNAADSYTRLEKSGKAKPPFEISIKVRRRKKSSPSIEVLDYAEGMDSLKLKEALKYGTQTSMGEDTEAVTSAEKGIGLKDAMMALGDNWLITIKDGLVNERNKHPNFATGFGKEDEPVTIMERGKLGILNNGTLVMGNLPEYFQERKFLTICERLQRHFLIRKLLENPEFRIYAIDAYTKDKRLLRYISPKIEKQLLKQTFEIEYNKKSYKMHLVINKTAEELLQGKPFGESGLLFFYGDYSVVDFTFCHFERDLSLSKYFGEVKMEVEAIIRDPCESPLVDEKRRGLDSEHPFNRKLFTEVDQKLKEIEEKEEVSKYSLDEITKREILRELNRIYKDVKGVGPREPPIEPTTFAFYPVYLSLKEHEPKAVALIINSSIFVEGLEISLQSTNSDIVVKRQKKIVFEEKPKEKFTIKQIELYSEKVGVKGEIHAIATNCPNSEKMGVEVLENPIFSPSNGFAFVPNKTTIVDGGEKKVDLCIDKAMIQESRTISLASSDPISGPTEWLLPKREEDLEKYVIKNIVKIEIPVKVKGTDHIGDKGNINASYEGKVSNLDITVVPEPSISGLFRDIRLSAKETKRVCAFIPEEGILELYYKHPLVKKYMVRNFRNRLDFLIFIADSMTREALRAIVTQGIKESSSKFPIFDMEHPESTIEDYVTREYYENGPKLHEMFIQLARTLKLGEEQRTLI
jgi:hypothetical protein